MERRGLFLVIGLGFLLTGAIILLNSFSSITGWIIFEGSDLKTGYAIGLLFLIGGIVILTASTTQRRDIKDLELIVGDSSKGEDKDHDRAYFLQDPKSELGKSYIRLGEFKSEIRKLKEEDPSGELYKIVQQVYAPALERVAKNGNDEARIVAVEFLKVLEYKNTDEEAGDERYSLPKEDREEIKKAFREYKGYITPKQEGVLSKYGITVERENYNKHVMLRIGRARFPMSRDAGRRRGGLNHAHAIIRVLEEQRNRGRKD